jgi:rhodanese-related sulfurtransferase
MHQFIEFSIRHWDLWLAFIVILGLLLGLELHGKLMGLPQVSPQEATLLVNHEGGVFLDLRDAKDFTKGHILDAINIPFNEVSTKLAQLEKYKATPIILITALHHSPAKMRALLHQNGYYKLHGLQGGISGWQSAGFPLVKDTGK